MDAWDNMQTKWGRSYTGSLLRTQSVDYTYSATTGRISGWEYNADGRVLGDVYSGTEYHYDEAGGLRETSNITSGTFFTQDGDGQKAKMVVEGNATHYLRSNVLGQTIAEIDTDGSRKNGFIHADGPLIATQAVGVVFWQHMDASQRSRRTTIAGGGGQGRDEVDPMDVKLDPPNLHQLNQGSGGGGKGAGGAAARVANLTDLGTCDFEGMTLPCGVIADLQDHVSSGWDETQDKPDYFQQEAPDQRNSVNVSKFPPPLAIISPAEVERRRRRRRMMEALHSTPIQQPQRMYDSCTAVNAAIDPTDAGLYAYEDPAWLKYGQAGVVSDLTNFAATWSQTHPNNPIGVGDLSQFGGAPDFTRHPSGGHAGGVVADLRPMRNDQVSGATNFNAATYSRELTDQLIQGLAALPSVVSIRFNDTNIQNNKMVRDPVRRDRRGNRIRAVHDNHMHVIFRSAVPCPVAN